MLQHALEKLKKYKTDVDGDKKSCFTSMSFVTRFATDTFAGAMNEVRHYKSYSPSRHESAVARS